MKYTVNNRGLFNDNYNSDSIKNNSPSYDKNTTVTVQSE